MAGYDGRDFKKIPAAEDENIKFKKGLGKGVSKVTRQLRHRKQGRGFYIGNIGTLMIKKVPVSSIKSVSNCPYCKGTLMVEKIR